MFTVLYFAGNTAASLSKPIWFDEYFTLDMARLPTAGQEWQALVAGGDRTPPLFQFATRGAVELAGMGRIGLRMPAAVGFWVMCLCLFFFARRSYGAVAGLAAFLVPMLTKAEEYGFEARGYGLMLGFCGMALVAWQRRWVWWFPLFMGAATLSHPYSVFILPAFGIGEVVRAWQRWRIDWGMAGALAASLIPIAAFSQMLRGAYSLNRTGLEPATWSGLPEVYSEMFVPFWTCAVAIAGVAMLTMFLRWDKRHAEEPYRSSDPAELAVIIGFLLAPIPVVAATVKIHGYFAFRYAIVAVIGVSLGMVFAIASSRRFGRLLMPATVLVLAAFLLKVDRARFHYIVALPPPSYESVNRSELPVYVQEPFLYLDLVHRWPAALTKRLRYVADPGLSGQYKSAATIDISLISLAPYTPLILDDYETLRKRRREFLLCYSPGTYGWLLQQLIEDGARVELLEQRELEMIYRVSPQSLESLPRREVSR